MSDHSKWGPDNNYKHLFTAKSHPNVDGHKLIATWLYKELKKNNWVSWK
jgi:lysophospholipase L1-like esterase